MLAASTFDPIFRTFHIMFGIAWAGSAFLFTVFVEPAAAKLGPRAGPVMHEVQERMRKLSRLDLTLIAVAVLCMATARSW